MNVKVSYKLLRIKKGLNMSSDEFLIFDLKCIQCRANIKALDDFKTFVSTHTATEHSHVLTCLCDHKMSVEWSNEKQAWVKKPAKRKSAT